MIRSRLPTSTTSRIPPMRQALHMPCSYPIPVPPSHTHPPLHPSNNNNQPTNSMCCRYIPKPELASVLIKMGLTMGSYNKAARGRARRNAMAEKSRVKWNILSQLVDTKREGLAKMIVKDAVNLGCNVQGCSVCNRLSHPTSLCCWDSHVLVGVEARPHIIFIYIYMCVCVCVCLIYLGVSPPS
jgi:hypothetical protein